MIGLGLDLVDLDGFRGQLAMAGSRFEEGVFTAGERRTARSRSSKDPAQHLAARFAAKEAFIKAWSSTMWGSAPPLKEADLLEIEVVQDAWGRPALRFHGAIAEHMSRNGWRAMVSLTHDGGYAAATVMLSKGPPDSPPEEAP